MPLAFSLLAVAIGLEVAGTAYLPRTQGFHDPFWSALVLSAYAVSTWLLSLVVARIPVSITYALWAGIGTAAIAVVGTLLLGEPLGPLKVAGISLIVLGVVVLNLGGAH